MLSRACCSQDPRRRPHGRDDLGARRRVRRQASDAHSGSGSPTPPSFWSRTSPRSIALRTASTISENEHEQNQDRPARRTAGRGRARRFFIMTGCTAADRTGGAEAARSEATVSEGVLPTASAMKRRVLPNGMTVFLYPRRDATGSLEARLVVRAGSLQETEEERGLAHYVEHTWPSTARVTSPTRAPSRRLRPTASCSARGRQRRHVSSAAPPTGSPSPGHPHGARHGSAHHARMGLQHHVQARGLRA